MGTRTDLPTGTVTFLRTDVEGSMQLTRSLGAEWDEVNETHLGMVRDAIRTHGGVAVRTEGDAVFAVFREAVPAMLAAIQLQRRLAGHPWPDGTTIRVRVGLHTGEAHLAGDDYGGFDVNRAARIAAVGHGGQIVVSDPTRALIETELPVGAVVRDLGRHILKDVPQPERLYQLDMPGLPTDFPPIRTGTATTGNLPSRLTSFVAREAELLELGALLEAARLLTITGPGGIGKTSLAIELARTKADLFPDGVWFVPLDALTDPALVLATIARALSIYDGPGRPIADGLVHYLAGRRTLLVLDNFEHVLGAAPRVASLLRSAPDLRVLVTSRAPLHVGGEQEYPLGTLAETDSTEGAGNGSPAARLFVERAGAVRPGWEPGDGAAVVEEICRLVDDLPLGIELTAARIGMLSPDAIRDRLAARLPLPGGGSRDAPARQRTLDDTIAWSYELLGPGHRRLLGELAVFEGGFDLEQAGGVMTLNPSDDPLDALIELADQSLIGRQTVTGHQSDLGGIRFRMLETIRAFALRQLAAGGEEPDARGRHAQIMLAMAETAATHLPGADQVRWMDRLAKDHGNLSSALRWAIEAGHVDIAQRLSYATWRYWQIGGHLREGRAFADAVIDMPRADEPSPGRLWSLAAAAGLAYWQADVPRSRTLYRAELETARQIGDLAGEADACFNLYATEFISGDRVEAENLLNLARERYRQLGDDVGLARTEWCFANLRMTSGHVAEAVERLLAAKRGYAETGDAMYEAISSGSLGFAYQLLGERREAMRQAVESTVLYHALRDTASSTITLASAAMMLLDFDRAEEVATVMGAFDSLCELHGVRPPAGIGQYIFESRVEERAYAALTSEQHEAAVRRGRAMSLDDAVAYIIATFEEILAEPD
jgi:predicted ATPase/class 3 adenylate cyclase